MRQGTYSILLGIVLLFGCVERTSIQRSADDPFLSMPGHLAYNVRVQFTDSNRIKAVLQGREGRIDEASNTTVVTGSVVVDFYNEAGTVPRARLTADSVVVNDRTKDMTAFGKVIVVSKTRDLTLTTSSLMWVNSSERVRTEAAVHIETGGETIDGIGMESNQDLSQYRLYQVRGVRRKS